MHLTCTPHRLPAEVIGSVSSVAREIRLWYQKTVVPLTLRVLYGDTDQMGVVYYANYLRYFEAGRGEFLRAHGQHYRDIENAGLRLPVVEATVRYQRPAKYDDVLVIETTVAEAKRASVLFTYRVLRGAEELATGATRHACLDLQGRPTRLPPKLIALAVT
jgi:acyl-CoA thioester hydrolase